MTEAGDGFGSQPLALPKRRLSGGRKARSNADALTVLRRNGVQRPADLSVLQSHPAWASLQAVRQQEHARTVAETLGVIGLPGAALGRGGDVLAVNKPFAALMPSLVREMRGRPRLTDPIADRMIGDALARLDSAAHGAAARTIPIRTGDGKPAAIAYLTAIHRAEHEPLVGIWGILIVVPLRPRPAPSPQIVQRLFGLSPAEARVACAIAARQTVESIAGNFSVSRETVRTQLKNVLAKTGCKRQLDLAVLLCGLQLPKA